MTVGNVGHPAHARVYKEVIDRGKELGIDVIIMDDKAWDANVESSNIDQLISQKVDGIIMIPVTREASATAAKRAQDKGIPVVTVWDDCNDTPYVGVDFIDGGGIVPGTKQLIQDLNGPQKNVVYIYGALSASIGQIRDQGFRDTIKGTDIKLIFEAESNWLRSGGTEQMQAALSRFPNKGDIQAVFCSDDDMALGALESTRAVNRLNEGILFYGIDGSPEMLTKIVEGEARFTEYMDAEVAGCRAAEVMWLLLNGKEVPEKLREARPLGPYMVPIHGINITKDNAKELLDKFDSSTGRVPLAEDQKWDVKNM